MSHNRAVFLDRDGTINHDGGYTHRVEDLRLIDHVIDGLQLISGMGFRLIITTNQSGIARGYFTEGDMKVFNRHLVEMLRSYSIGIDAIYHCPYHPTVGVGHYHRDSDCRKPKPGMLLQAAGDHGIDLAASYVIGDKKSDTLAGQAAGCRTILILTGAAGAGEVGLSARPDYVASNMLDAASIIQHAGESRAE